ncbi:MAG: hypothetical protein B7Y90_05725 [Alphaproteobacteria bacterium 32-64-14]|nr:MAG: hypothetical protein B7Y90_05725 [Alphaproteobacteria bacterium 32-64-14]
MGDNPDDEMDASSSPDEDPGPVSSTASAADANNTTVPHEPSGYGNPPKQHRFKKGQSGNPSGKRKSSTKRSGFNSLPNAVERELDRKIVVTESGRRRRVTKRDLVAKNLTNSAVKGDLRASRLVATLTGGKGDNVAPAVDPEAERLRALNDVALHFLGYAVVDVAVRYAAEMMQTGVREDAL